jgi:hypothetical protein
MIGIDGTNDLQRRFFFDRAPGDGMLMNNSCVGLFQRELHGR